jgi:IgGFc binding protein
MLKKSCPYCFVFAFLLGACASSDMRGTPSGAGGAGGGIIPPPSDAGAVCPYGQTVCDGNVAKVCDGQGGFSSVMTCPAECKDGLGCVRCIPNASSCASNKATVCDATGTNESSFACEGLGMSCEADGCHGECSPVSLGMGYQGCEFLPTVTFNSVWSDRARANDPPSGFHFGILLGNVSTTAPANVTITGPTSERTVRLQPGEAQPFTLDWVLDLKGPDWEVPYQPGNPTQSVKKANGAYRIVSDKPIIAYQFNAYENEIPDARGCPAIAGESARCYAYSGDGSLLLPVHALSSKYVVAGFHAWHKDFATLPGAAVGRLNMGDFISITAPQANTEVTIKLRPNQGILSGPDIPRVNAGDQTTITLGERQVLQLFTPGLARSDTFSGTEIEVKDGKRVQVLSGVGCVNILDDESPCGHIEDSVLPYEALGKDYVVPILAGGSTADAGTPIAQTIRIQAVADGTPITFEPKLLQSVTLSRGDLLEFSATSDIRISSTTPFAVTQYLTGRSVSSRMSEGIGSPNQLTVAPVAQFRTSYAFLVSPQFASNYVTVVAPTGTAVSLDGQPVAREKFLAVGASGMSVARVPVAGATRVHSLTADKAVGLVVFGIGPYGSYALTGGLDLKRLPIGR